MIAAIKTGLDAVLKWFGIVLDALLTGGEKPGALNALLPVLVIAVGISLVLLTIKVVRKMAWGA